MRIQQNNCLVHVRGVDGCMCDNYVLQNQDINITIIVVPRMDQSIKKLREVESLALNDTITTIAMSPELLAVGTLDDSISFWARKFSPFAPEPVETWSSSLTGLIDLKFTPDGKYLVSTSMDSQIRITNLQTKQNSTIEVPVMSAWKLAFMDDKLVVCGDAGIIEFYDLDTRQSVKKMEGGEVFFTSLACSTTGKLLVAGNNDGEMYVLNSDIKQKKKQRFVPFKAHEKLVRSVAFSEDQTKIYSGSDDSTLKIFDLVSQKFISSYDGHRQSVSCVRGHPHDNKLAFSCSFDKSIKIWDFRVKACVDTYQSGGALWALECTGRNLLAGGETGAFSVFSLQ